MSALVDRDILAAIDCGDIVISPFDRACLGTNSYDVHLAPTLLTYRTKLLTPAQRHARLDVCCSAVYEELDLRKKPETVEHVIGENGFVLEPGELYLASTLEHTESHAHLPMLNGRSSIGRYGLSIHVTAGTGDVGFTGPWTMELFVVLPLRIYAGVPIGQLLWFTTSRAPLVPYGRKPSAKYNDAGPLPQASKLHEELARDGED